MSGWNRGFLLGASALVFAALAGVAMAWGGMRARAQSLSMVDQFGGASYAVALQGDALYAGAGPRVLALSAGDPASPALLARSRSLAGVVQRILPAGGEPALVPAHEANHPIDHQSLAIRGCYALRHHFMPNFTLWSFQFASDHMDPTDFRGFF